MTNIKRVFKFVKGRYRFFFLSIFMIIVVQVLGFITPLLVKTILDDYLLGVEYDWVEVTSDKEKTVSFENRYFKQVRYLDSDDEIVKEVSVVIYKTNYYFVEEKVINGHREIKDNQLLIEDENKVVYTYDTLKLNAAGVFAFYQPIIPSLIIFILLLFIKSIIVIGCLFYSTSFHKPGCQSYCSGWANSGNEKCGTITN